MNGESNAEDVEILHQWVEIEPDPNRRTKRRLILDDGERVLVEREEERETYDSEWKLANHVQYEGWSQVPADFEDPPEDPDW